MAIKLALHISRNIRIGAHFLAYGAFRSMTGQYLGVGRKGENLVLDAFKFLTVISTREVGTTNAHAEECVAGDDNACLRNVVAYSARCVARCM